MNRAQVEHTVTVLKQLDEKSMLLIANGAQMLLMRQKMENQEKDNKKDRYEAKGA